MNKLIEEWQRTAKKVQESETAYLKCFNMKEEERTYTYKYLASRQLELLEATKPDKEKDITEQMNHLQKECYNYLKKVAETGEL